MSRRLHQNDFVRFFVPVLLSLMAVRILILNGALTIVYASVVLLGLGTWLILTGTVPTGFGCLIVLMAFLEIGKAWFKFFTPDDVSRERGRQLTQIRSRGSQRSPATSVGRRASTRLRVRKV